jgi:uncharacterized membrane protein YkvI
MLEDLLTGASVSLMFVLISLIMSLYWFALIAAAKRLEKHDIDIVKIMEELNRHNFLQ